VNAGMAWTIYVEVERDATVCFGGCFRQRRKKLIDENVGVEIDRLLVARIEVLKVPFKDG